MHILKKFIVLWLLSEIIVAGLVLTIVPDHLFLRFYLPQQSKASTQKFLNHQGFIIPDSITGWRNQINIAKGNWIIDQYGSRAHKSISLEKNKRKRLMFLGNSMVNGGTHVSNQETLSAYIENDSIEAVNFAVMLYSIDQSMLLYENYLQKFKPDILIVGLDTDPIAGLKNMYIPFRSPQELNMPFIKPRFIRNQDNLDLVSIDINNLKTITQVSLPNTLVTNDAFYYRYKMHKLELMPIGYTISIFLKKIDTLLNLLKFDQEGEQLLVDIMKKFSSLAEANNTKIIFLSLPGKAVLKPGRLAQNLPDKYSQRIEKLKKLNFPVIDASVVLKKHLDEIDRFYAADNAHLNAAGNKLVAEYLSSYVQ